MPTLLYCWRCRRDVPMQSDEEYAEVSSHAATWSTELRARMRARQVSRSEVFDDGWLPLMLQTYRRLTGVHETNINVVGHHVASIYGPPCRHCGKTLRTPQASFCFLCHRAQDAPG